MYVLARGPATAATGKGPSPGGRSLPNSAASNNCLVSNIIWSPTRKVVSTRTQSIAALGSCCTSCSKAFIRRGRRWRGSSAARRSGRKREAGMLTSINVERGQVAAQREGRVVNGNDGEWQPHVPLVFAPLVKAHATTYRPARH